MYQRILKKIYNLYTCTLIILVGVVRVISADIATFDFIKGIAATDAFYRACVIGLKNLGNRELINPTWYISYGVVRHLPHSLPANEAGIFTFDKTACKTNFYTMILNQNE